MSRERVTFRLRPDLLEQVDALARHADDSRSAVLERLVSLGLKRPEPEPEPEPDPRRERIRARARELHAGGMATDAAVRQAQQEVG